MTADTRSLAETYFRSWKAKDFDTLRSILAENVTFRGPMGTADGADDCLKGLEAMGGMMTRPRHQEDLRRRRRRADLV